VTCIEMADPMIGTSLSFGSSGIESSTSGNEDSRSSGRNGGGGSGGGENDDAEGNDSTHPASTTTPNISTSTTCMECNLIPTNHTCLKGKHVRVCSICCDGNRGLQNNPWCKTCFENETPASQAMIRNGDYNFR
jgi:hypothetical protein